jgi:two-component system chemotaxis sensor kinase CheA
VPLTLAIINGFTVSAGAERYVIPLESVVECVELDAQETRVTESSGVFNLRGHPLPYLRLRETFQLGGTRSRHESIVVVEHNGGRAGLAVDALHGQSETVVKPLGRLLEGHVMVTSSTILADGHVAFILDVPSVVSEAERRRKSIDISAGHS